MSTESMAALERAIAHMGGAIPLARAAGISKQVVYFWLQRRQKVSPALAKKIEQATGGVVTREELRPDVFGPIDEPNQEAAA